MEQPWRQGGWMAWQLHTGLQGRFEGVASVQRAVSRNTL